ncbi:MAG: hypothetical protein RR382_01890 [Tannerellaceae bacterium]
MIGSLIGAGLSAVGSIGGALAGRSAAKKQAEMLKNQQAKNQAWYDRRYNEDSTQRADAQAALTRMKDAMTQRSQASAGAAAVMGAGPEAQAVENESQNQALAATVSNIAQAGEQRKDAIEGQYLQQDAALTGAAMGMEAQKGQNIAGAIGGIGQAAAGIATSFNQVGDAAEAAKKDNKVKE